MDYLLNDEESDNDLASKILYFLIQGFSCYHARLRAGIFKFSSAPQAVFPVQKKRSAPTGASSYHIRTSIIYEIGLVITIPNFIISAYLNDSDFSFQK